MEGVIHSAAAFYVQRRLEILALNRQTLLLPTSFVKSQRSEIYLGFFLSKTSSPEPSLSPTERGTMRSIMFEERNSQGTSPFFNQFPLEMRCMIYTELFDSQNVHVMRGLRGIKMEWSPKLAHWICDRDSGSPHKHKCIRKDHEWQCLSVHLMFTCKQMWVFSDHHNLSSAY